MRSVQGGGGARCAEGNERKERQERAMRLLFRRQGSGGASPGGVAHAEPEAAGREPRGPRGERPGAGEARWCVRGSPGSAGRDPRRWSGRGDGGRGGRAGGGWTFSVASVGTLPVILEGVRLHGRAVPGAEAWLPERRGCPWMSETGWRWLAEGRERPARGGALSLPCASKTQSERAPAE